MLSLMPQSYRDDCGGGGGGSVVGGGDSSGGHGRHIRSCLAIGIEFIEVQSLA